MADPSDAELDLLKLFWRDGPLSVRAVHDRIGPQLGWAPSTTRTVLERMCAKGLLERQENEGGALFAPRQSKVDVLGRALRKFARQVLEIEGPLSAQAFTGSQLLNSDEIAELQALLDTERDAPSKEGR
jgi:BlaI family transcriptional regulator, penicillinase repressor